MSKGDGSMGSVWLRDQIMSNAVEKKAGCDNALGLSFEKKKNSKHKKYDYQFYYMLEER